MLAAQGCDRIVEEIESGVKARKRLDALLASLQAGDDLIIEQIDRLGRTAVEVILVMDELHRRGSVLRILALPALDYSTPHGKYVAQTFAALAEMIRGDLRQRQRQGIEAAKRAGRHLGRPRKLNGQQIAEARSRIEGKEPVRIVARAYGVTPKTLRSTLAR